MAMSPKKETLRTLEQRRALNKKRSIKAKKETALKIKNKNLEKKANGRPTILNASIQEKIIAAIVDGAYVETAVAFAGIHKDTFYDWLKKGAKSPGSDHANFSDAIQIAMAKSEIKSIRLIDAAAEAGEWKAAAWKLERMHYKRWGLKSSTEISGKDGGPIKHEDVSGTKQRLISKLISNEVRAKQEKIDLESD